MIKATHNAIQKSSENSERARRNKNDVRAHFAKEGVITIDLDHISDNKIN